MVIVALLVFCVEGDEKVSTPPAWPARISEAKPSKRRASLELPHLVVVVAFSAPPGCTEELRSLCPAHSSWDNIKFVVEMIPSTSVILDWQTSFALADLIYFGRLRNVHRGYLQVTCIVHLDTASCSTAGDRYNRLSTAFKSTTP